MSMASFHQDNHKIRYAAFEYWPSEYPAPAALLCKLTQDDGSTSGFTLNSHSTDGGCVVYDLKADVQFGAKIDDIETWVDDHFTVDLISKAGVNIKLVTGARRSFEANLFTPEEKKFGKDSAAQAQENSEVLVLATKSHGVPDKFILPSHVYILNKRNQYLRRWGAEGLRFEKTVPDEFCRFTVVIDWRPAEFLRFGSQIKSDGKAKAGKTFAPLVRMNISRDNEISLLRRWAGIKPNPATFRPSHFRQPFSRKHIFSLPKYSGLSSAEQLADKAGRADKRHSPLPLRMATLNASLIWSTAGVVIGNMGGPKFARSTSQASRNVDQLTLDHGKVNHGSVEKPDSACLTHLRQVSADCSADDKPKNFGGENKLSRTGPRNGEAELKLAQANT
ncbi:hypothetical protein B0H17DRAFT_1151231 [Mycena rosella]|uniref:Uncharacterized protein n=1 Tax=Mycena rosella TaxID=1033263 RepID=A0AAD7BM16_MYCRO|nr:hypothetical protein B0H17DRAFT_1151231 [Mycena rosella]